MVGFQFHENCYSDLLNHLHRVPIWWVVNYHWVKKRQHLVFATLGSMCPYEHAPVCCHTPNLRGWLQTFTTKRRKRPLRSTGRRFRSTIEKYLWELQKLLARIYSNEKMADCSQANCVWRSWCLLFRFQRSIISLCDLHPSWFSSRTGTFSIQGHWEVYHWPGKLKKQGKGIAGIEIERWFGITRCSGLIQEISQ